MMFAFVLFIVLPVAVTGMTLGVGAIRLASFQRNGSIQQFSWLYLGVTIFSVCGLLSVKVLSSLWFWPT